YRLRLASQMQMDLINLSASFAWTEANEGFDGMASLAHTTFQHYILHDTPEQIDRLIEELSISTDKKRQEMLQSALGNVHICVPDVVSGFLQSLKVAKVRLVQEALVNSLSWFVRGNIFVDLP